MRTLLIVSAAIAWTALCAYALANAYRSGVVEGRTGAVDRARRPRLFTLNIAFMWLALTLGPAALIYAWIDRAA